MPKWLSASALCGLALSLAINALAADDPNIQGDLRTGIQSAMSRHIEAYSVEGRYVIYDAVDGQLLRLSLDGLHEGIVKKGDFYVSCADFTASDGTYYDLDMLVFEHPTEGLRVLEAVVHKKGDEKRKYHIEN